MSGNKIILTIPKPCAENWGDMTPVDKGRYCAACQKTVIDFTVLTDRELFTLLNKSRGQDICGHAAISQLGRELAVPAPRSFSLAATSKVAAVFLLVQTMAVNAWAQTVKPKTHQVHKALADKKDKRKGVSGTVKDELTGELLKGMTVQILGTAITDTTNTKGSFFLALPDSFQAKTFTITATYPTAIKAPDGTIILEETVELDSAGNTNHITLYRSPAEKETEQGVKAYKEYTVQGGVGGTPVMIYKEEIQPRRHWPFHKKIKNPND